MSSLDGGKLTSVDQHGDRVYIIPAEVKGFFRRHRDWSQLVLLAVFLILPWTTIGGHQSLLIDIPHREFAIFGILFRAHDAPLLFFVLAALALGLAFVTSIWGRIWCGWACPQTVFIDAVYRRIEIWVEGNYLARRKMRDEGLTRATALKKSLKWFLFVAVSSVIAHSFLAYFVGAKTLLTMMSHAPEENFGYFSLVLVMTALILFDFAWFREQFCVIMCPYGRIQSLLLDQSSMAVVYDADRGEPRKGAESLAAAPAKKGDCVSCNRCVQVCPTGIDIRNGLQMDCIACSACIDACDEIMDKVHKPRGLISYKTLDGSKLNLRKPRALIYLVAIFTLVGGLSYAISQRSPWHAVLLRASGLPYSFVRNENGEEKILNHFKLHLQNQTDAPAEYTIELQNPAGSSNADMVTAEKKLVLAPGEFKEWHFFVRFSEGLLVRGKAVMQLKLTNLPSGRNELKEFNLLGPTHDSN